MAKTKKVAEPATVSEAEPSNRPVHELRFGRVRCSVWENPSESGPWYSVKLTRLYKTDDGWRASPGLNRDDLLPAAKLCEEAALWIARRQQQRSDPDGGTTEGGGEDIPF
jgi:hypothetical protein